MPTIKPEQPLYGASGVMPSLGFHVSRMGFFRSFEVAKVVKFSAKPDLGNPSSDLRFPGSANKAAFCGSVGSPPVLRVDKLGRGAEVGNSVVCANPVYMVDPTGWPFPVRHCPRNTVGKHKSSAGANGDIAMLRRRSGDVSGPAIAALYFPAKYSRFRIIGKNLMKQADADGGRIAHGHSLKDESSLSTIVS